MNITPVMYTDPTGMSWISDLLSDFLDWLNSVPESSFTIPSFDQIESALFNILGGGYLGLIEKATKLRISKGFGIGSFKKLTKGLNKFSKNLGIYAITIPLAFDIGNTWTENNGNTIWQRFAKTGVILLNTAIVVGTSFLGVGLIVSGLATGNLFAIAGGAVILVIGVAIADYASRSIYGWLDIE